MKKSILAILIAVSIGTSAFCMETVELALNSGDVEKLLKIPTRDIALYYKTADIKKDINILIDWATVKCRDYQSSEEFNSEIIDAIPSLFEVAMELGSAGDASPSYQYKLGEFLLCKIHAAKYAKEGFNFTKLAADKGFGFAQMQLADLYEHGIGVEKDEKESFRYCKLATSQSFPGAQWRLIDKYENGSGVEPDILMVIGLMNAFKDISEMGRYLDFVDDITVDPVVDEISIEDQLPSLMNILNEVIPSKANLHNPAGFRKTGQNLEIPELSPLYAALAAYGNKINFIGGSILQKLDTPGFCISCLQPTELFMSGYRTDSEGERTMFCIFVAEGMQYSFIGKGNPEIGYGLKQLLGSEKDEAFKNLDLLEASLRVARSTTMSLLSMYKIGDGINMPQIKQIDEELALVPTLRKEITDSIGYLNGLVKYNLKARNDAFLRRYIESLENQ